MYTRNVPARLRGILVAAVCLAGGLVASPVFAQQCPPDARIQSLGQTVNEGADVTPNGNSSKPNNATFLWTVDSGPGPVTWIPNATVSQPKFVAPQVAGDQQMVIRLTVTGCGGETSTTTGTITIKDITAPPANTKPTAIASANPPIASEGVTVTLNGSGSTDPENNPLTYAWTQTGGPPVTLSDAGAAQPTFVAPNLTNPAGATLTFDLRVTDTGGLFSDTSVVVNVLFANDSPFASLHCPLTVNEGASVTLDGSASKDYEDDASGTLLQYRWSQLQGPPNIDVGNETGETVTFNAPVLGTGEAGYIEFELRVTDSGNLHTVASCAIFIEDVTAPVFSGDGDRTEEATGPGGANVFYDGLAAIDNVEGDVSDAIVCVPPSGWLFGIGPATTVACAVEDANHNGNETSFNVRVQDTTKPVIAPQNDIAMEATGPTGRVVTFDAPQTFDVVDIDLVATCDPPSGSTFPLGSTIVDCDATDTAGNAAVTESFTVTIVDETAPDVTVPADITLEATSSAGAVATFGASATDIVDGDVDTTCIPPSGSTFALGTNGVTCSATDKAGNTGSASFSVIVEDTTPPTLSLPDDITAEATSSAGAVVSFVATASDIVDGDVDVTCAPASGSQFDLGDTTVNCSATDAAGNTANGSFKITVQDTTPPVVAVPADMTEEANIPGGKVVTFATSAFDIVSGSVATTCIPASGGTFALGSHTVACSATDGAGNTGHASFSITVQDTTAPSLTMPDDITEEATSPAGATATFAPTATDLVDMSVDIVCVPASGSTFALGDTTVDCTATDDSGNDASGSFTVKVEDTTPPSIAAHDPVNATASANSGANVAYAKPTATDIVDGDVAVNCLPASGSWFNVGSNTVTCTAKDSRNNTATSTFQVIVSYNFSGFFRPVDNLPVANVVQAGQAIPVKFSLGGNQGMNIFTAGYPRVQVMSCANNTLQDTVEETVTAGNSSLQYQANGEYHYVWKTDKAWAGTCRQLQLTFADGKTQSANFTFRK